MLHTESCELILGYRVNEYTKEEGFKVKSFLKENTEVLDDKIKC